MKKFILGFTFGLFSVGSILAASGGFPDVKEGDWFYPYVMEIKDWGIVKGNDDGTYAPGRNINRAEFSKMISLYDKRVDEKIAQKIAADPVPSVVSDKKNLPSLMYLRRTTASVPVECPKGWEEVSYGSDTSYSVERVCMTNQRCQTLYMDLSASAPGKMCPSGWSEADYGNTWGSSSVRRTCYICE